MKGQGLVLLSVPVHVERYLRDGTHLACFNRAVHIRGAQRAALSLVTEFGMIADDAD
jgi:hypothetical protein